jgi:Tfp pilus assembly protein PilN
LIEINLAPGNEGRRGKSRGRSSLKLPSVPAFGGDSRTLLGGAVGVLLILVLVFGFWKLSARRADLEARVGEEVRDSTRFATTIGLVHTLEARQDTIRQKIGVIREVDRRRYVWPHLLDEISGSVPSYTWLEQITSTESADTLDRSPGFSIQGDAGSTQALTRFMKNLENSPFIRGVTLVTSEQQDVEGRTIHKFTIEAKYETPDSSAIETVPIVTFR